MKNTGRVEWIERLREYAPWRRSNHSTKSNLMGWADPDLDSYLESLSINALAGYSGSGARQLHDINATLCTFAKNAWRVPNRSNLEILVPLMLFYRAHSAFKAAIALGLGGAMTEAMPVLRLCLECAAYASITHGNFATATVWLYRSDNDQTKAAANSALWNAKVQESIARRDAGLAEHYVSLYRDLIEFGAYKNELSVTSELLLEQKQSGKGLMEQIRRQDNATRLDDWLRSAGQVGLCVLKLFELLFPPEFAELGISKRIYRTSKRRTGDGFQSLERAWQMHMEGRR